MYIEKFAKIATSQIKFPASPAALSIIAGQVFLVTKLSRRVVHTAEKFSAVGGWTILFLSSNRGESFIDQAEQLTFIL